MANERYKDPLGQHEATQDVLQEQRMRRPTYEDVKPAAHIGPIPSDNLWQAGKYLEPMAPGIGNSVKKIGGGLRLEPRDYLQSAVDGAAYTPGIKPITTMARMAEPARALGSSLARADYKQYNNMTPAQMLDAANNTMLRWANYSTIADSKKMLHANPVLHDSAVYTARKNNDELRNLLNYHHPFSKSDSTWKTGTPEFEQFARGQDALRHKYGLQRERAGQQAEGVATARKSALENASQSNKMNWFGLIARANAGDGTWELEGGKDDTKGIAGSVGNEPPIHYPFMQKPTM